MAEIKAVIFDFIGTLTNVQGYSLETSELKLYKALAKAGFSTSQKDFLEAYDKSQEKYHIIRFQELVEVTNAVWISGALNSLGFNTNPEDARIKTAVNVFFEDYLNSLELKPCVRQFLASLPKQFRRGLVSNFTYAPVIYAALRRLSINRFFNAVLVSEDVGWRKPNIRIFQEALKRLGANAGETVYIGDSPLEDIGGAAAVGMRTIFLPSQFYTLENLEQSHIKPDLIVKDICELHEIFPEFIINARRTT
ncbi:MAG TPA: HAD family hydrolase [Patescibacteria group bacterium]|nr:HAD family hydrolase [Patescibacteria group bacterium]